MLFTKEKSEACDCTVLDTHENLSNIITFAID